MEVKHPIVFISYSHDDEEHQDKVLEFSNKLRGEGIDCVLDQYEESPPEGWPKWMDRGIRKSEFVLLICTETFYNRLAGEDSNGKGVQWESTIIYQHLYKNIENNTKFIPVVFKDKNIEFIPEPIQGVTYYDVSNKEGYDKLYWRLRGVKTTEKPSLGKLRSLPEKERKSLFISGLINQEDWDKANWKNGAGYLWTELNESPPILVLLFETLEKGQDLFKSLIKKLSRDDKIDRLRISIVEGAVPNQKNGYFITIGENFDATNKIIGNLDESDKIEFIALNQRIHRVFTKKKSPNLQKFKEEYEKFKCYYLAPGEQITKDKSTNGISVDYKQTILKRKIEFRNYEEISEKNDPDSILKTEYVLNHKF